MGEEIEEETLWADACLYWNKSNQFGEQSLAWAVWLPLGLQSVCFESSLFSLLNVVSS